MTWWWYRCDSSPTADTKLHCSNFQSFQIAIASPSAESGIPQHQLKETMLPLTSRQLAGPKQLGWVCSSSPKVNRQQGGGVPAEVTMPVSASFFGFCLFWLSYSCSSREDLADLSPANTSYLTFKALNVRKGRQRAISGAGGVNASLCKQKAKVGKRVDLWGRAAAGGGVNSAPPHKTA